VTEDEQAAAGEAQAKLLASRLHEVREYLGLSCEEIGTVMGVSHKAVKSTLFRARDEFRSVAATMQ